MNMIIEAALSRIRTVVLLFLLAMIMGMVALNSIPKESTPDISVPFAYISINHEGISPEDADRILYKPMYKELKGLSGLKEIIATASQGHLSIQLEFEVDVDIDEALVDVREAVDTANGQLPSSTDEPTVKEINLSLFPVMVVGLSGNVDEKLLFTMAKDLQEKIEALPGVLEAKIQGDREEVAEIIIDPAKLDSYNIDHGQLFSLISNNNQLVAAGNLDTGAGRFSVKVPGLIESTNDILTMPVKVDGDQIVRFADIAFGHRTYKDADSNARINGKPALAIEVSKRLGSNIIETLDEVKKVVREETQQWNNGIEVTFSQDQSIQIIQTLDDLFNNVLFATLLVMVIIIASLGPRSSVLVGVAIPGSFLIGILVLSTLGYTLNMVVLFALILSVGMLVDGAIVVTEYADRRMAEGAAKRHAFAEAAKRMSWPIIASTATTLAVFIPLVFWPGVMGEFMKFLPITVLITLSASLLMALIVVPSLGAWFGGASTEHNNTLDAIKAAENGEFENLRGFSGRYIQLLEKLLHHPLKVLGGTLLVVVFIMFMYGQFGKGVEFFPDVDAEIVMVDIRARGNLSLEEKDQIVKVVEKRLYDMAEIKTIYSKSFNSSSSGTKDLIGQLQLELQDWQIRRQANVIMQDIRDRTTDIAGIIIETKKQEDGPASGSAVQLELTGDDSKQLIAAVKLVRALLNDDPELIDIKDSRALDGIEWQLDIDREAASRMGTDIASVGRTVKMVTNGLNLGAYRPDDADDELDIRLRFPTNDRTLDQLDQLRVSAQGQLVPISSFTSKTPQKQSDTIIRNGNKLRFMVEANVREGVNDAEKRQQIDLALAELELPKNVLYRFKGDAEQMAETGAFLLQAFLLAIFLMATILVTQFNSFYRAGLVMSAIFLSFIGVFLGLMVRGEPFGIVMSGVGMIALAGIVVNNNIVLIDTYAHLRRDGLTAIDAALRTGAQRLRPVLLTTITTVCGLIPMVYQLNIDLISRNILVDAPSSQWWTQLSTAIAGGLAFATILTLILTPCLLVAGDRGKDSKSAQSVPSVM